MVRVTQAVFSKGVLRAVERLRLRDGQRVRLIIELLDEGQNEHRAAALNALRAGISSMAFSSAGQVPTRDELHDRP
jgi:predicted DNA-binding antitoxin AbrB/MazE fold protein